MIAERFGAGGMDQEPELYTVVWVAMVMVFDTATELVKHGFALEVSTTLT